MLQPRTTPSGITTDASCAYEQQLQYLNVDRRSNLVCSSFLFGNSDEPERRGSACHCGSSSSQLKTLKQYCGITAESDKLAPGIKPQRWFDMTTYSVSDIDGICSGDRSVVWIEQRVGGSPVKVGVVSPDTLWKLVTGDVDQLASVRVGEGRLLTALLHCLYVLTKTRQARSETIAEIEHRCIVCDGSYGTLAAKQTEKSYVSMSSEKPSVKGRIPRSNFNWRLPVTCRSSYTYYLPRDAQTESATTYSRAGSLPQIEEYRVRQSLLAARYSLCQYRRTNYVIRLLARERRKAARHSCSSRVPSPATGRRRRLQAAPSAKPCRRLATNRAETKTQPAAASDEASATEICGRMVSFVSARTSAKCAACAPKKTSTPDEGKGSLDVRSSFVPGARVSSRHPWISCASAARQSAAISCLVSAADVCSVAPDTQPVSQVDARSGASTRTAELLRATATKARTSGSRCPPKCPPPVRPEAVAVKRDRARLGGALASGAQVRTARASDADQAAACAWHAAPSVVPSRQWSVASSQTTDADEKEAPTTRKFKKASVCSTPSLSESAILKRVSDLNPDSSELAGVRSSQSRTSAPQPYDEDDVQPYFSELWRQRFLELIGKLTICEELLYCSSGYCIRCLTMTKFPLNYAPSLPSS